MLELGIDIRRGYVNVLGAEKKVIVRATDQYGNIYNVEYEIENDHTKYIHSFRACRFIKDIAKPKTVFFMLDNTADCKVENLLYDDIGSYISLYQTNLLSFYHWQVENGIIKIAIGYNV